MNRFIRWLLIPPPPGALFFTRIRRMARTFHVWRGHRWETPRWNVLCGTRKCIVCGQEQWLMMNRLPQIGQAQVEWVDVYRNELP